MKNASTLFGALVTLVLGTLLFVFFRKDLSPLLSKLFGKWGESDIEKLRDKYKNARNYFNPEFYTYHIKPLLSEMQVGAIARDLYKQVPVIGVSLKPAAEILPYFRNAKYGIHVSQICKKYYFLTGRDFAFDFQQEYGEQMTRLLYDAVNEKESGANELPF